MSLGTTTRRNFHQDQDRGPLIFCIASLLALGIPVLHLEAYHEQGRKVDRSERKALRINERQKHSRVQEALNNGPQSTHLELISAPIVEAGASR